MSHVVTVRTEIRDAAAVRAACQRLQLLQPVEGTHRLFISQATGLAITLPKWRYPAVCDLSTGQVHCDNFKEHWGELRQPQSAEQLSVPPFPCTGRCSAGAPARAVDICSCSFIRHTGMRQHGRSDKP